MLYEGKVMAWEKWKAGKGGVEMGSKRQGGFARGNSTSRQGKGAGANGGREERGNDNNLEYEEKEEEEQAEQEDMGNVLALAGCTQGGLLRSSCHVCYVL